MSAIFKIFQFLYIFFFSLISIFNNNKISNNLYIFVFYEKNIFNKKKLKALV